MRNERIIVSEIRDWLVRRIAWKYDLTNRQLKEATLKALELIPGSIES